MRILIVDDDMVTRKKLQVVLNNMGTIDLASSGGDAMRVFKEAVDAKDPFDVVFLDYELPGFNGAQVLTRLRAMEKANDLVKTRIVIISSYADSDIVTACIKAGCDDYIVKPFQKDTILAKIKF